jgi:cystine transport system permease protein
MMLGEIGTILLMLMRGMLNNIGLWFISGVISLCGGILLGCLSHAQICTRFLTVPIRIYVVIMRSIPLYVHILYVYFVMPHLIGINLSPWMAALVALVVCVTAYCTEVIRAAINALPLGQWEAAQVLGYSYWQTVRYIIGPQGMRIAIPSLMNLSEELIKATAIVSTVGVMDITRTGMNIIARTMQPELVYTLIACLYFILSIVVNSVLHTVARRFYGTV